MCSITGIWRLSGKPVSHPEIKTFNDATAYRGPDGEGTFIDQRKNLALGHRRLSILDLSDAGKQPMFSAEGKLVITFNGEIYNYLELKAELAAKGHAFKTGTDTEVILAAYREWKEECLFRFNGMWALAIWDIQKRSLFLSRDRFGVKPLYYVYRPGKLFAFASESVAFRRLEGFACSFDENNVDLGIRDSFYLESVGETVYQNVQKLLPGHWLKMEEKARPQIKKWWKTEDHLPTVPEAYADQVAVFKELFWDACKVRLRSDVPVGVALSGGLDSSTVYATVQKIFEASRSEHKENASWRNAFIACFPDTKLDEQYFADEVINYTGGHPNYIYPNEANVCDAIYAETKAEDYLYMSPPVVHNIYREMRKRNVIVSLDGHGADEMLFGYPDMVNELIDRKHRDARQRLMVNTWAGMTGASNEYAEVFFTPPSVTAPVQERPKSLGRFIPEKYKRIYRNLQGKNGRNGSWLRHNAYCKTDPSQLYPHFDDKGFAICYYELHRKLPTLLRNWDRASMRHGVEIRMPFLDWRLVTFIMRLPDSAKVGEGYSKRIVRDAVQGWLPDTVRLRKSKIGINAPLEEWLNGPMAPFVLDIVNSQSFLQSAIWNGHVIREHVESLTKAGTWTQKEAMKIWPYLNAWILMN